MWSLRVRNVDEYRAIGGFFNLRHRWATYVNQPTTIDWPIRRSHSTHPLLIPPRSSTRLPKSPYWMIALAPSLWSLCSSVMSLGVPTVLTTCSQSDGVTHRGYEVRLRGCVGMWSCDLFPTPCKKKKCISWEIQTSSCNLNEHKLCQCTTFSPSSWQIMSRRRGLFPCVLHS